MSDQVVHADSGDSAGGRYSYYHRKDLEKGFDYRRIRWRRKKYETIRN